MISITIYRSKIVMVFLLFITIGCDEFTAVDFPEMELTGVAVFEDSATVDAAFASIYSKLRDDVLVTGKAHGINTLMGLYADELDYYGVPGENSDQFYRHVVLPSNWDIAALWNGAYNLIYAANSIIEGVTNSGKLSESEKERFLGEGLFVRAYMHYYLVSLFGDIPYIKTTDYTVNSKVSRMPEGEVFALLIQDLQEAEVLLMSANPRIEKTRPAVIAVRALMARAYLYNEAYALAREYSTKVIENGGLDIGNSVAEGFNKSSTSTIWQLKPEQGSHTWEAFTFIFVSAPPPFVALTSNLIDSFEVGDARRENWIGEVSSGDDVYYYPNKYKQVGSNNTEYSILLRLAEQYLIRAEASAQLGDNTAAVRDLNVVRLRVGLAPTEATSRAELLEAIAIERRHELFTEQGHRWFDLKRTGMANIVLAPVKPGWRDTDVLLPLPEAELLLNKNLEPQNPGY